MTAHGAFVCSTQHRCPTEDESSKLDASVTSMPTNGGRPRATRAGLRHAAHGWGYGENRLEGIPPSPTYGLLASTTMKNIRAVMAAIVAIKNRF